MKAGVQGVGSSPVMHEPLHSMLIAEGGGQLTEACGLRISASVYTMCVVHMDGVLQIREEKIVQGSLVSGWYADIAFHLRTSLSCSTLIQWTA